MGATDWQLRCDNAELMKLHEGDPLDGLDSMFVKKARERLCARAAELSAEQLVEGYAAGAFGVYGPRFLDHLEGPARWGYRDADDDAKELARAVKKKGADPNEQVAPALRAACARFEFSEGHAGSWTPMHRSHKTRAKLLALALEGTIEVEPGARCVFSPFSAAFTRALAAAGPLPLIAMKSADKVSYRDPVSGKEKVASPSYEELYLAAWARGATAAYTDLAGAAPLVAIDEALLVGKGQWTAWAWLPSRGTYLVVDKKGLLGRLVLHSGQPIRLDLSVGFGSVQAESSAPAEAPVSVQRWASSSASEVRQALLPADVAPQCPWSAAVLVELFALGGGLHTEGADVGLPRLPLVAVHLRKGVYELQLARALYSNPRDAPEGEYHQVAYAPELQASLCIRADDPSEDPVVYDIDHEGWLRGTQGTLGGLLRRTVHPRA